jgi:DNA-binding transcriptional LysR family regulator
VGIRYCAPDAAPAGAVRLFGEEVMPMCSPALAKDKARPLREPADLRHHVLLHDEFTPNTPWLDWTNWLEAYGLRDMEAAGDLRFSHYDQMIQAALDGQGVALGRLPLLSGLIRSGRLVAPFEKGGRGLRLDSSSRSFYVVAARGPT